MHSNLNIWLILLLSAYLLAAANAQTAEPLTSNTPSAARISRPANANAQMMQRLSGHTVLFRESKMLDPALQPPTSLGQVTAQLSARLVGGSPNLSIEFVLRLQNNGAQEVKMRNPLDSLSLLFSTVGKKLIPVPEMPSKVLIDTTRDKKDMPFPAPVVFRQIVRGTLASADKEEVITIRPGETVKVVFESEPIIMERVMEALRAETGEGTRSFKAKGFLSLINDSPQTGGRTLYSDPIVLTIPAP